MLDMCAWKDMCSSKMMPRLPADWETARLSLPTCNNWKDGEWRYSKWMSTIPFYNIAPFQIIHPINFKTSWTPFMFEPSPLPLLSGDLLIIPRGIWLNDNSASFFRCQLVQSLAQHLIILLGQWLNTLQDTSIRQTSQYSQLIESTKIKSL